MLGILTSWVWPIQGLLYLLSTPSLLQLVLRFLGIVTAASILSAIACFWLLFNPVLSGLAWLGLGVNLFTKLLSLLLVTAAAAVPIVLVFEHRLKKLGRQLFDATLQLKLSGAASAAVAPPAGDASQQAALGRVASLLAPLPPADAAALAEAAAKRRRAAAAAAAREARASLPWKLLASGGSLLAQLLFKPRAGESGLMRKAREFTTLGAAAFLPILLPLAAWRDSGAEAGQLMQRLWLLKGVHDPDAQDLLLAARMSELRGFGLMAATLEYVPVVNWGLALSNHVAAALYAAHLEKRRVRLFRA